MMYGGDGWGWSVMMLMPLLWITLLGVIIWAVVRLTQPGGREHGSADQGTARRESPQEILDRRFASGEIDAETYTQTRDRLAGREPGSS
jgi:putative membrane protein